MADCGEYMAMMSCFIDNELSNGENILFRQHLETCASCRARLVAYETIANAAAEALEEPPAELSANVMKNVRAIAERASIKTRTKKPAWKPVFISSATAAACLALVFLGMPRFFDLVSPHRSASGVPEPAYSSAPASEANGGSGLNASMKSADAVGTEGVAGNDSTSPEVMMGLTDSSGTPQPSESRPAQDNGEQAQSNGADFEAYYATIFIKGQLPELLKDNAMNDNGDGTYSLEISVQTADRLMKYGYKAVMGDKNMTKALVIYSMA